MKIRRKTLNLFFNSKMNIFSNENAILCKQIGYKLLRKKQFNK